MSADNWAVCPRCRNRHEANIAKAQLAADAAYGTKSLEEFDALRAEAEAMAALELTPHCREDYEFFGLEDGAITAHYRADCKNCGLKVVFDYVHPFDVSEARS